MFSNKNYAEFCWNGNRNTITDFFLNSPVFFTIIFNNVYTVYAQKNRFPTPFKLDGI